MAVPPRGGNRGERDTRVPLMEAPPLQLAGVTRRFGARTALAGASFEVGPGELIGLVGPNGSGKTTLLKVVAGFLRPDEGQARVFGLDPYRDQARVMERARFAFAPPALFAGLTGREHLVHLARIAAPGSPRVTAAEIDRALETVGLAERGADRVAAYSFGMRQRLALAQALLPRPELLVLDEPTDGLDPLAILELRGVLVRLREEHGTAILLSSHLLVEIESLVDRLLVLSEGRTLFQGTPAELLEGGAHLRLRVSDVERARAALSEHGLRVEIAGGDGRELVLERGAVSLAEAAGCLAARGVALEAFHEERPTLEDALLERLRAAAEARP